MKSLRKAIAIQFFVSNGATVVNFFLIIILARILTPIEIGIFSMTSVVVNFSHVFRDFGVSAYIRRAKVLTPEIIRSATGVLVTSSWVIATLLFFSSDYVAAFFKQPGVGQVMRVLAVGFYFIPLGAIPQAVLAREMNAEKSALVVMISVPVYVSTSLILAYNGFSYMSMAWANLVNIITTGLVFTVLRPKGMPWLPSLRGWRDVAHFGVGAMLSSTIRALDNAVPDIVLGKMSGPRDVGLFSRSNSVVNIFNTIAGPTINYMALPYLAQTHHEGRDLAAEVARAISLLTGLIWSALAVIASLAPDIIALLYGPAWAACAPIVPMLCIACAVQATFAFMQPALTGIGRPYWSAIPMASSLIVKVMLVAVIFKGDLISFSWIVVIAEIFSIPGYLYLARRHINLPTSLIVKSTRCSLAVAMVMVLCAALLVSLLDGFQTPFIRLTITLTCLAPVWVGAVFLFGHPLREELKTLYQTLLDTLKGVQSRKNRLATHAVTVPQDACLLTGLGLDAPPHSAVAANKTFLIYGAIAWVDDSLAKKVLRRKYNKRLLREFKDRAAWSFGSTAWLDYRNYQSPVAINVGDAAIAIATRQQFSTEKEDIFTNVNWGAIHQHQQDEADAKHKLLIFAGSGYVYFSEQGDLAERLLKDTQTLEKMTTPAVLYGVGVNQPSSLPLGAYPFQLTAKDEDILRRLLARTQLISVRDVPSQTLLSLYTDKPIALIGDPALFLIDSMELAPVTRSVEDRLRVPRIGLNFSFHGPFSSLLLKRNLSTYVKMIKAIQRQTGCTFSYIVHYDTEKLIPKLLIQKGIVVDVIEGNPVDIARAYANLDVHIGGMLHSCILAVGANTPCIGLAYDIKHYGFFDLMDISSSCFSASEFDPKAIVDQVIELLQSTNKMRFKLAERRGILQTAAKAFVDDCYTLAKF